jgi:hypothetical protein
MLPRRLATSDWRDFMADPAWRVPAVRPLVEALKTAETFPIVAMA